MDIFWSTDWLARATILGNALIFAGWLLFLAREWRRLASERASLLKMEDVSYLVANSRGRDGVSPDLGTRDRVFESFLKRAGVAPRSVAAVHVRSIHEAGWSDSRLDVSELVRHTSGQLLRASGPLRSILGVFIVVGLFGTLAGLSKALGPLSALDLTAGVPTGLEDELSDLLEKLKSAFAPSVVGVLLTAVGVVVLAIYNAAAAAPLRHLVDRLSIRTWLPQLYPTTSQRVLATLGEAERLSRENLQAAKKVAEFAEGLEGDLADFAPKVAEAGASLTSLDEALGKAVAAASILGDASKELATFQSDLKHAYDSAAEQTKRVGDATAELGRSAASLAEGVGVLRVFEEAYVDKLTQDTSALLLSTSEALDSLTGVNEGIVRAVGEPIVRQLAEIGDNVAEGLGGVTTSFGDGMGKVDATLHERLSAIREGIAGVEDPVRGSADRIEGIAATFDKSVGRLLGELKREFDQQNEQNAESQRDIAEMGRALAEVARALQESSSRQDRLVDEVAALARKAARPGVVSRAVLALKRRRNGRGERRG